MKNTSKFSTCDFCDDHRSNHESGFRVLPPIFKNFGGATSFKGLVATVKCYEDNTFVKSAVESSGEGRVLVVDGGGSLHRALLGGNLAAAAVRNGWAGIVINGAVRDVSELNSCPIGIMALALLPMPTQRNDQGERDVSVHIQGVWIHPRDWLYADADGIVVSQKCLE